LEVYTLDRLTANPLKLRNALRSMGWIGAARDWPLETYKSAVLNLLSKGQPVSFDQILALGVGRYRALYGAAVLTLTYTGVLRSDLNESPLTPMTLFYRIEG
jgi:hypothetical protein